MTELNRTSITSDLQAQRYSCGYGLFSAFFMFRTIIDLNFFQMLYDEQRQVMRTVWRGFFSSEAYRLANQEVVAFANKNKVTAILADVKESGLVKEEDHAWVAEHLLPKLFAQGLKHIAYVMPTSIFTELSLKKLANLMEEVGPVEQCYFQDAQEAEAWLNKQLQPAF